MAVGPAIPGTLQRERLQLTVCLCNLSYRKLISTLSVLRQLDCLRQLVVVLCERSQLKDLVQFPYVNLHDEVISPKY